MLEVLDLSGRLRGIVLAAKVRMYPTNSGRLKKE